MLRKSNREPVSLACTDVNRYPPAAHRPSISSAKPTHAHAQSYSSLPVLGSSTNAAQPPPAVTPEMYLARAPRPQKQPGWLSYVFGTTPGHAETSDPEKEAERRTSIGTLGEHVVPGTFPVAAGAKEPREEVVRTSRPAEVSKAGKPAPAQPTVAPTSTLVLPSTYVKSTAQPQTFASTLASPPIITGTPAYGLSSARGTDGLSSAERIRKEWLDAQKEARKAARREERRREREAARVEQRSSESRVQQVCRVVSAQDSRSRLTVLVDYYSTAGHCADASAGNPCPAIHRFPRPPASTHQTRSTSPAERPINRQRSQRDLNDCTTPSRPHPPLSHTDDPLRRTPPSGIDASSKRMGRPRRPPHPRRTFGSAPTTDIRGVPSFPPSPPRRATSTPLRSQRPATAVPARCRPRTVPATEL